MSSKSYDRKNIGFLRIKIDRLSRPVVLELKVSGLGCRGLVVKKLDVSPKTMLGIISYSSHVNVEIVVRQLTDRLAMQGRQLL